jgi:integrase/recombinase XerD
VSLDIGTLPGGFSIAHVVDFTLFPEEVDKGREAAARMLEALKTKDEQESAREALMLMALVLSTGERDAVEFPWQQVRSHHLQAALEMLKEDGAPARVEALRCQNDPNRKFRQVPEAFNQKRIQILRTTLRRVMRESKDLGYLSEEEWNNVQSPQKARCASGRIVSFSEFRALLAICDMDPSVKGLRDSLMFYLLYHGGLMLAELLAVTVEDLSFDDQTGKVTVLTGKAKNQKKRRVELPNEALICLEDWLEMRGSHEGPLINPIKKGPVVEIKRITGEEIRKICEKRAQQAGVALFSPDEMRKSTAELIRHFESSDDVIDLDAILVEPKGDTEKDGPGMAKICFPYWEQRIVS